MKKWQDKTDEEFEKDIRTAFAPCKCFSCQLSRLVNDDKISKEMYLAMLGAYYFARKNTLEEFIKVMEKHGVKYTSLSDDETWGGDYAAYICDLEGDCSSLDGVMSLMENEDIKNVLETASF